MTENLKPNNLLGTNFITIDDLITSDTSSAVNQLNDKTFYVNPNMLVENTCIYTSPLPAELASNFPEGTVLQMLPDSTLIAIPPVQKYSQITSSNNSLLFKNSSSLPTKFVNDQNSSIISNLLVSSNQNESQTAEVPICSEGNMSDIDLSFLNESDEPTSKNLNEAEVKELQSMIDIVEPNSISALQHNPSTIIGCNLEHPQAKPPSREQPEGSTQDVVMIDVTKPIQLSQNSVIMVNGRKCILQQDSQTGQVIAYPVKEPDKPRRKRGRPRKVSVEHSEKDASLETESVTDINVSEDEKEKGLLEIINDDGSLVRRSLRKRKTKVLKDYETGNLKQELGSDVEDVATREENETQVRKRKYKSAGRPKKQVPLQLISEMSNSMCEGKRSKGRPRKPILENEPTQAFLVQTADGQTLMMQVPLSSIPEGVTLQEVAQSIANKLNIGLSEPNSSVECDTMQLNLKEATTGILLNEESNLNTEEPKEPVVQDHSIGSTTNCSTNENNFRNDACVDDGVDSSCPNIMSNFGEIIADSVSPSQEINEETLTGCKILNGKSSNLLPENILENHFSNVQNLSCSEANFSENIPTSNSSTYSSPVLSTQECASQLKEQDSVRNISHEQFAKDFLMDNDFLKDKVNLHFLLQNVEVSTEELATNIKIQHCDEISSSAMQELPLNSSSTFEYLSESNTNNKNTIHMIQEMSNFIGSNKTLESYNFLNFNNASDSNSDSHLDKESRNLAIISSIEHDHDFHSQGKKFPSSSESQTVQSSVSELSFINSKTETDVSSLQNVLPVENIAPSFETSILSNSANSQTVVSVSEAENLSEKVLPIILPSQEKSEIKTCKVCRKNFDTEDHLVQHFKADHPKNICNECNYTSEHSYVVKRHALRHTNNGCICSLCGKLYKDHYILKMHIKMVHMPADTIYTCDICNKNFTRKAHLKRHLRIHQPNRPYQCSLCSYRGVERSDINKHVLVHQTPKHKCPVCGKCFRYTKNKELHMKRHLKQRDYKCGLCDFYGYTFTDIRKHIERRHAGSKFNCSNCGMLFKNKEHKKSDQCQKCLSEQELSPHNYAISHDNKNTTLLQGIPVDILDESEQSHTSTSIVNEDATQEIQVKIKNRNVLNSAEEILSTPRNEQLIINGLESSNILHSENLSVIPEEGDSSKLIDIFFQESSTSSLTCEITIVTENNKVLTLPLKPAESLENILTTVNKNEEAFLLSV